jgi:hypothetical protein
MATEPTRDTALPHAMTTLALPQPSGALRDPASGPRAYVPGQCCPPPLTPLRAARQAPRPAFGGTPQQDACRCGSTVNQVPDLAVPFRSPDDRVFDPRQLVP